MAADGRAGCSDWHALLWVALAVGGGGRGAARGAGAPRGAAGGSRALALVVARRALFAGYVVSGAELELLRPRHWDELVAGLGGGLQALGTVRLPYASADPWPRIVLELLGAELLILAGLLTFWPRVAMRRATRARRSRCPTAATRSSRSRC